MSEYIEVRSMEEVAYLLNVLFTNLNNLDRTYYDMFINPVPMDIELQRYDENGNLTTVTLPNRAKDKITTYAGQGNPNGLQEASTGAFYIDTRSKEMYYKGSGSDAYGWINIWSTVNLNLDLNFLTPDGDGSQLTNLNANSITSGTLPVQRGGTGVNAITGLIKGNGVNPFTVAEAGVDYVLPSSLTGLMVFYPSATIPDGWLLCDGSAYSRETYAHLFSIIGTTYGDGDGETTFNVPDLRDYYIKGWNGTRALGQVEQGHIGVHSHSLKGNTGSGTQHRHDRGTYEIEGRLGGLTYDNADSREGITGYANNPFSWGSLTKSGAQGGTNDRWVSFRASKNWTGYSGYESVHTHSLTGLSTETAGVGENTVTNLALVPIIKY